MTGDITLTGGAGEYMESATVVSWEVALGDRVKAGQVVAVVETAKAATEIEAGRDGLLTEILAPVGTEVGIGALLGRIGDSFAPTTEIAPAPLVQTEGANPATVDPATLPSRTPRVRISPLARRLAQQAGLDYSALQGTGPGGRIKSRDIELALKSRGESGGLSLPTSSSRAPALGSTAAAVPLVLIHGFGANAGTWNSVRARLDPSLPVLTPELPGHGRAPALAAPSLDGLAQAVLTELERSDVRECDLVGHSLGGAVAAALSTNPAIRVRSLTLIAPAGLGPEIDGAFLSGFLSALTVEGLAPWLERLVGDATHLPRGYAQAVLRERERRGVGPAQAAIAQQLFPNATQAIRIADDLARFAGPLKVVWGRADRIIPPSHQHDLPGHIACHRLGGVGHMPHVEAPELVSSLIAQCVRSAI